MSQQIIQLIRSCSGYVYETAGIINGFFDDPQKAKACAHKISRLVESEVSLCGCELTVSVNGGEKNHLEH
ncbi:MAG: hypothetical protein PHE55_17700 [Methylococcaceae bacterium]|nr:hypothetical protein [Methylococcaceae bacterium]